MIPGAETSSAKRRRLFIQYFSSLVIHCSCHHRRNNAINNFLHSSPLLHSLLNDAGDRQCLPFQTSCLLRFHGAVKCTKINRRSTTSLVLAWRLFLRRNSFPNLWHWLYHSRDGTVICTRLDINDRALSSHHHCAVIIIVVVVVFPISSSLLFQIARTTMRKPTARGQKIIINKINAEDFAVDARVLIQSRARRRIVPHGVCFEQYALLCTILLSPTLAPRSFVSKKKMRREAPSSALSLRTNNNKQTEKVTRQRATSDVLLVNSELIQHLLLLIFHYS